MMECYQKCSSISKQKSHLSKSGSCADCGKLTRPNLLAPTASPNSACKACNLPPICCGSKSPDKLTQPTSLPVEDKDNQPSTSGTQSNKAPPAAAAAAENKQPDSSNSKQPQEKQSFWQWLLSLVGLGSKSSGSGGNQKVPGNEKGHLLGLRSHNKPIEIISPQAAIEEGLHVNEVKKHSKNKSPGEDKNKDLTSPGPETKKKKRVRTQRPGSPSPKTSGRRSSLTSPQSANSKSPQRKTSASTNRESQQSPTRIAKQHQSSESGGDNNAFLEKVECLKRPPTSPIYSSTRYLLPYEALDVKNPNCHNQCCELISPKKSKGNSPKTRRRRDTPASPGRSSPQESASCTMSSCSRGSSPGCSRPNCPVCPSVPSCPCGACPPSCGRSLCISCSPCCLSELKNDIMKKSSKRRGSCSPSRAGQSSCAKGGKCGGSGSGNKQRKRSNSCPSSPMTLSRKAPNPPPCPCSLCNRPKPPACPCAGSGVQSTMRQPSGSGCGGCSKQKSSSSCGSSKSTCKTGCPITCMKPCCLPSSTPSCSSGKCNTACPTPFSIFSSGTCPKSSYARSKDNDSLCKYLMAKYNIIAPEPRVFCPIPSSLGCAPCGGNPSLQMKPLTSKPPACPACDPKNSCCSNNNRPTYDMENARFDILESYHDYPIITLSSRSLPMTMNNNSIEPNRSPRHQSGGYRIPKRPAVGCIKKNGPRSHCEEYMSTHDFIIEPKRRKVSVGETSVDKETDVAQPQSSSPEKAAVESQKSPPKSGKKSKKSNKTKLDSDANQEETGENKSSNRPPDSPACSLPSGILNWRESSSRVIITKKSRSKSIDTVAKSRSPVKNVIKKKKVPTKPRASVAVERNHPATTSIDRYSSSSKIYYPNFLALSKTTELPKTNIRQMPSPKVNMDDRSSIGLSSNTMLSQLNSTVNFSQGQSYIHTNASKRIPSTTSTLMRSPEVDFRSAARTRMSNIMSSSSMRPTPTMSTMPTEDPFPETFNNPMSVDSRTNDDQSHYHHHPLLNHHQSIAINSVEAIDSEELFTKPESITSLVEKYDRVELDDTYSSVAQSKCNIFDYISEAAAASTSIVASSEKEDPSLPVIPEVHEENDTRVLGSESSCVDHGTLKSQISTQLGDLEGENELIESEDINNMSTKAFKKIDLAHGDNQSGYEKGAARKTIDSVGEKVKSSIHCSARFVPFCNKVDVNECDVITLIRESSVDPIEFGMIGESAVDPIMCTMAKKAKKLIAAGTTNNKNDNYCQEENTSLTCAPSNEPTSKSEMDSSNNHNDDEIDSASAAQGEDGDCKKDNDDDDDNDDGGAAAGHGGDEKKSENTAASVLQHFLNASGVKWTKMSESSAPDILMVNRDQVASALKKADSNKTPAVDPSVMVKDTDPASRPFVQLLKPGEIESSMLCSSIDGVNTDTSLAPSGNLGTPV